MMRQQARRVRFLHSVPKAHWSNRRIEAEESARARRIEGAAKRRLESGFSRMHGTEKACAKRATSADCLMVALPRRTFSWSRGGSPGRPMMHEAERRGPQWDPKRPWRAMLHDPHGPLT